MIAFAVSPPILLLALVLWSKRIMIFGAGALVDSPRKDQGTFSALGLALSPASRSFLSLVS